MPDMDFTEETCLSRDGMEITVCRPVLEDAERGRREALVRRGMCELYEAWWKSTAPQRNADKEKNPASE